MSTKCSTTPIASIDPADRLGRPAQPQEERQIDRGRDGVGADLVPRQGRHLRDLPWPAGVGAASGAYDPDLDAAARAC